MSTTTPTIGKAWTEVADAATDFKVTFVSRGPKCEYAMVDGAGDPSVAGRIVSFPSVLQRDTCGAGRLLMQVTAGSPQSQCTLHVTTA